MVDRRFPRERWRPESDQTTRAIVWNKLIVRLLCTSLWLELVSVIFMFILVQKFYLVAPIEIFLISFISKSAYFCQQLSIICMINCLKPSYNDLKWVYNFFGSSWDSLGWAEVQQDFNECFKCLALKKQFVQRIKMDSYLFKKKRNSNQILIFRKKRVKTIRIVFKWELFPE